MRCGSLVNASATWGHGPRRLLKFDAVTAEFAVQGRVGQDQRSRCGSTLLTHLQPTLPPLPLPFSPRHFTSIPPFLQVGLWVFGGVLGVDAVTAAILGLSALLITGVVTWKECLLESVAWDTLTWFAALIAMANYLNKFGLIAWFSQTVVKVRTCHAGGWEDGDTSQHRSASQAVSRVSAATLCRSCHLIAWFSQTVAKVVS